MITLFQFNDSIDSPFFLRFSSKTLSPMEISILKQEYTGEVYECVNISKKFEKEPEREITMIFSDKKRYESVLTFLKEKETMEYRQDFFEEELSRGKSIEEINDWLRLGNHEKKGGREIIMKEQGISKASTPRPKKIRDTINNDTNEILCVYHAFIFTVYPVLLISCLYTLGVSIQSLLTYHDLSGVRGFPIVFWSMVGCGVIYYPMLGLIRFTRA